MLRHRGIQVLLVLILYFSLASLLPQTAHQGFYTISLLMKDVLMWILPLTVAFFIAHAVCSFKHQALFFIITLVIFEALSNFSSVWVAYLGGHLSAGMLPPLKLASSTTDFSPLFRLPLGRPSWWSADKGALFGLVLGCAGAMGRSLFLKQIIEQGKTSAEWVLKRLFARLIPLFVLGFVARMAQTNLFHNVAAQYSLLLIWLVALLAIYLLLIFLIGCRFSFSETLRSIKNLLPPAGVAFTSGCSISTMPWTIEGTSKNLQTPSFAKAVIPATTNIQQIGDCLANTFLCFLLYRHFFGVVPDVYTWFQFSVVFVLARFATAAVIGGAIFIMLPIYENYLFFNAEMIAIILAFNVLLDPLITASNVMGNGALCKVYERVWLAFLKRAEKLFPALTKKE